jgi:homoserine acetyltransferase
MVRSQASLVKRLGIEKLDLVAGASMGGMQSLAWGSCIRMLCVGSWL